MCWVLSALVDGGDRLGLDHGGQGCGSAEDRLGDRYVLVHCRFYLIQGEGRGRLGDKRCVQGTLMCTKYITQATTIAIM